MEIKKCINCGSFITTNASLCTSCANKITYENTVLKNYFDENTSFDSISSISVATGVSPKSIQSFMIENNYMDETTIPQGFSTIQY